MMVLSAKFVCVFLALSILSVAISYIGWAVSGSDLCYLWTVYRIIDCVTDGRLVVSLFAGLIGWLVGWLVCLFVLIAVSQ